MNAKFLLIYSASSLTDHFNTESFCTSVFSLRIHKHEKGHAGDFEEILLILFCVLKLLVEKKAI